MKMDSTLHRAKKVLVQVLFDLSQKRARKKQAAAEQRAKRQKLREEAEIQRLRKGVMGPDDYPALSVWQEVMGKMPNSGILEVQAARPYGSGGSNYLSFSYHTDEDLEAALSGTHWGRALDLLDDDCKSDYSVKPPPPWPNYWPFQPGASAKVGGQPSSRPFFSDCYYYYLDREQGRFFLSTGKTHEAMNEHFRGLMEKYEQGQQAADRTHRH